jgi:hypothetical protein
MFKTAVDRPYPTSMAMGTQAWFGSQRMCHGFPHAFPNLVDMERFGLYSSASIGRGVEQFGSSSGS